MKVIALDPRKLLRKLVVMEGNQALAARHSQPLGLSISQLQPSVAKTQVGQAQFLLMSKMAHLFPMKHQVRA